MSSSAEWFWLFAWWKWFRINKALFPLLHLVKKTRPTSLTGRLRFFFHWEPLQLPRAAEENKGPRQTRHHDSLRTHANERDLQNGCENERLVSTEGNLQSHRPSSSLYFKVGARAFAWLKLQHDSYIQYIQSKARASTEPETCEALFKHVQTFLLEFVKIQTIKNINRLCITFSRPTEAKTTSPNSIFRSSSLPSLSVLLDGSIPRASFRAWVAKCSQLVYKQV